MREEFEEIEKKSSELNPHLRGMRNLLGYAMHELHDGAADCSVSGPLMKGAHAVITDGCGACELTWSVPMPQMY
jgi:hypothetical protein